MLIIDLKAGKSVKPIKIIACRVGEAVDLIEIDNTLDAMQQFVGGYIQIVQLGKGLALVCDDEGKLKDNMNYIKKPLRLRQQTITAT